MKRFLIILLAAGLAVSLRGQPSPPVPPKANQAQAEAGTDNNAYMTALRTAQAITAQGGGGGSGTVTSVNADFTGGLISVSGGAITTSGTLSFTLAGTSGGIPYFSDATHWASSGALALNSLMIGGGAGGSPATTITGTGVLTGLAATVNGASGFLANNSDGTLTHAGSTIRTPATITISANAGTIDVTKAYSQTQTLSGATALTVSAVGTSGEYITVDCVIDSTLRVVTFKNADASTIAAVSCPPSLTTTVLLRSTGAAWTLVGGSPNLLDASADTTPATTKLVGTVDATTGVTAKSTIAQIHAASAGTAETLTNKRMTARVGSTTSSATPTVNTDSYDIYKLTAQTADITSMTTNLTGTPVDGDQFMWVITGTAARAITWGTGWVAGPAALPTTTTTTKTLYVYFQYDSVVTHWVCMYSGSLP